MQALERMMGMFKVIIADDEPGALKHIRSIVEMKCPDYEVIDMAENGMECLLKVREKKPDVVITDVKMPLMNGVDVVEAIKEEFPDILSVIISGYQEFEYARSAIQSGVCDYILKPVLPSDLQKTMDKMACILKQSYYQKRNSIVHSLCNGKNCDGELVKRFFLFQRYYGAVIRKNGLPRRFFGSGNIEIFSDINEIMTIYGRDEMEALYIIPEELLYVKTFEQYMVEILKNSKEENQYMTLVYKKTPFSVKHLQEVISDIYRTLDTYSVVGLNQVIDIDALPSSREVEFDYNYINTILEKLEFMLKEQQLGETKRYIKHLFSKWKEVRKPQLWMENVARQILFLVGKYNQNSSMFIEGEYMLEDSFYYSASLEELIDNLLEVMFKDLKETEKNLNIDSPEFFEMIQKYIKNHITDALSLQSVCKHFGLSQTYMSKLFRKYEDKTFNHYVTKIRMERATELMKTDSKMFVKDIAALVGYNDQFYFSRIFRSYIGKCPTDYMEELQ